jgi:1,4-alpha-glucan branching enzyme
MHDTLAYWSHPGIERSGHHRLLTFGLTYAWAEHFVLPLSHDEVVHLKKPLLGKMPGNTDEVRFAHLRSLYAWMWGHPGKQLLFMGAELAEEREWSQDRELDWPRLDEPLPAGVATLLAALNDLQRDHPVLHESDAAPAAFRWLLVDDAAHATFAFERQQPGDAVVVVANLSDDDRTDLRLGLPTQGAWHLALSTDDVAFGGSTESLPALIVEPTPWHAHAQSALVPVPARTVLFLVPEVAA